MENIGEGVVVEDEAQEMEGEDGGDEVCERSFGIVRRNKE